MDSSTDPADARRSPPGGVAGRLRATLLRRPEAGVAIAVVAATLLLRRPAVPAGIYALGVAGGAALALQGLATVLVYRTNRIINFAQAGVAFLSASVFVELVRGRLVLQGLRAVCPPCVRGPDTVDELLRSADPVARGIAERAVAAGRGSSPLADVLPRGVGLDDLAVHHATGALVHLNFWVALVAAVVVGVGASYVVYVAVVRRFERASRLIATVATIGTGQLLVFLGGLAQEQLGGDAGERAEAALRSSAAFPFTWRIRVGEATLTTPHLIGLVTSVVVAVGLVVLFARTRLGVAMRAAAERPERARTLGIDITSVNTVAWLLAGLLTATAAVLAAAGTGAPAADPAAQIEPLVAAVFGGLTSLPLAVLGAFTVSIVEQSILWSLRSPGLVDLTALVLVVVVLVVQRAHRARVDSDAGGGWRTSDEMRPVPSELRDLDVVQSWRRGLRVVLVTALLGVPWVFSPAQTNLATVTLVFGVVALSLLVLTGWAGQISLGQFAFAAVGAFVTAVVRLPFPLPLVAAALAGAAVAVAVGLPALRLRGLHLAVSTLAFAVTVTSVVVTRRYLGRSLPDSLDRPAFLGLDLEDERTYYTFVLVVLVAVYLAVVGMRRSRLARVLIAARENEAATQAYGVDVLRARLAAFAISGFLAALAGGLFAYSQHGVAPESFGVDQSIKMFLTVVIGGTGSAAGPLVGAAYIGLADIFGRSVPLFSLGATGLGVVAVLLFAPGGLDEVLHRIRDAGLRRVADRRGIHVASFARAAQGVHRRAPISPKVRRGGGAVFVGHRYRAAQQWAIDARKRAVTGG